METVNYLGSGRSFAQAQAELASVQKIISHGYRQCMRRTYFLRLGFLDGREGFMLAVANGEGSYYRYLKLMLLCEKKP